ncbi:MAG: translation initiation factor IF-2 [Candidatus Nanoarchaeia archaeon]
MLRQVIVTVMGNVDSGKSATIDQIKKSSIVESEPGRITQSIKAYAVSLEVVKEICKNLFDLSKIKVPGLLFLDTPGHRAFSNLRRRGGSLADIAIVVVDINEGLKPQTIESIEILKQAKTPFVIALNKIDLVPGWHSQKIPLLKSLETQNQNVKTAVENKMYNLVAEVYKLGFNAERFDRIEDYTKQIAMIPMSAKTGEGLPELLMVITGLAQRFLEVSLKSNLEGPGKGTVLEVVEEKGLGATLDVILYDGHIKVGDQIVVGTLQNPIVTKIKALLVPDEGKFKQLKEVSAAVGIKIAAPNVNEVIPGMPIRVANKEVEKVKIEIMEEVKELTLELDDEGVVAKADSLGSLEGLINLLREKKIKIKRASIGPVSKKDLAEASSEVDPLYKVVLAFNVKAMDAEHVKVFSSDVIYTLIEKFEEWVIKERDAAEAKKLKTLTWPCKIKILEGYIFRQSNPAIVGVEIMAGKARSGTPLIREKPITTLKAIQHEGKNVEEAIKGMSVAVSLSDVTMNRQVKEGDILYADMSEDQFRALKRLKKYLNEDEIQIMKELAEIKRKDNPSWGV